MSSERSGLSLGGFVLLIGLLVVVAAAIWLVSRFSSPPGDERVITIPDPTIPFLTEFPERLEAFRAEWDIYDRFETWPALLPLAKMAQLVYEPLDDVKQPLSEFGFSQVVSFLSPFHSQVGYIASGEDVMVIVFRGTDDTEDWIQNVNTYHHQSEDGAIHAGFATSYSTLRHEIAAYVEKYSPKHLWVTGHSLGGAMAVLCAYDLERYWNKHVDGLITFGQPMVGRAEFTGYLQNAFGLRFVHFVNGLDGVPRLPFGYAHCGLMIWFDGEITKKSESYRRMMMAAHPETVNVQDNVQFVEDIKPMTVQEYSVLKAQLDRAEINLFPPDREIRDPSDAPIRLPDNIDRSLDRLRIPDAERKRLRSRVLDRGVPIEDVPLELRTFSPGTATAALSFAVPWKDDHRMTGYVERIERAIERARGSQ